MRIHAVKDPTRKLQTKPFFPKLLKDVITAVNGVEEEETLSSQWIPLLKPIL